MKLRQDNKPRVSRPLTSKTDRNGSKNNNNNWKNAVPKVVITKEYELTKIIMQNNFSNLTLLDNQVEHTKLGVSCFKHVLPEECVAPPIEVLFWLLLGRPYLTF